MFTFTVFFQIIFLRFIFLDMFHNQIIPVYCIQQSNKIVYFRLKFNIHFSMECFLESVESFITVSRKSFDSVRTCTVEFCSVCSLAVCENVFMQ